MHPRLAAESCDSRVPGCHASRIRLPARQHRKTRRPELPRWGPRGSMYLRASRDPRSLGCRSHKGDATSTYYVAQVFPSETYQLEKMRSVSVRGQHGPWLVAVSGLGCPAPHPGGLVRSTLPGGRRGRHVPGSVVERNRGRLKQRSRSAASWRSGRSRQCRWSVGSAGGRKAGTGGARGKGCPDCLAAALRTRQAQSVGRVRHDSHYLACTNQGATSVGTLRSPTRWIPFRLLRRIRRNDRLARPSL